MIVNNKDSNDEESIFQAALELDCPTERMEYLRKACGNNHDLLKRLQALLELNEIEDGFLEDPPTIYDMPTVSKIPTEAPGTLIDRYKVLEKIGEGGMAVVYMAEQTEPIRRKVALKIIKLGMDTKSVIARFEAERQALAMMDHPNIAKVLDAGATETGRPYFVMELVKGVSITEYCDKNNLSTKDRMALFTQVCNAVQHAHQKGIIHRDIKPTNVMVTQYEGRPIPKVIDFGIAKATNQRLTEKTLFTRYAHIIGTPAYMSPEQAELSDLDVDTRTDIYSLGVLLYELLTGTTPFSEEELRRAGQIEMQRIIREQEPTKPSTKLSTLGKTLTDIAKHRNATPDVLRKAIRGDLDWIVMKSLEKDRSRRYETANMLALDIRRHLEHETVMARGPSTTYRLQKFLSRHRSQTIAALVMLVIVIAVFVILSMWNRDRLQLAEAESFRHRDILFQAREQYAKADQSAALEMIKQIIDSKHVGPEAKLLYAGILINIRRSDEAVNILSSLVNERPEIAGAAHSLLARMLWESGSLDNAMLKKVDEHRRKAEQLLPETAEAYFLRAMTAIAIKGKLAFLDEALHLDPGHYESYRLRALTDYASRKYEKVQRDTIAMIALRPRDPLGHSLQAAALHKLGHYDDSIEAYDSAIRLTARDDPQYVDLITQRCDSLMAMGQYDRVIADALQCLEVAEETIHLEFHIFCALTALGNYEEANSLFERVVKSDSEVHDKFKDWSKKYVFDQLQEGRLWHPFETEPHGVAFLPMLEAQRIYRNLSVKAKRLITDAFTAHWSPDGTKLAFSTGFHGYSGVAVWDAGTRQTDLLIVPGKDPEWSPDGLYLVFVRDCQSLPVSELAEAERIHRHREREDEEVWIMKADGTEPRHLASGSWPCWSHDPNQIYFYCQRDGTLCKMSINDHASKPQLILKCTDRLPEISPDSKYVACEENKTLKVLELASGSSFAEWTFPFKPQGKIWSADGRELCFGVMESTETPRGLWIRDFNKGQTLNVLEGPIRPISLAPDNTKLIFNLDSPYFEIWVAELDRNTSIVKSLGPGQTIEECYEEYYQKQLALHTQRIEANPENANNYFLRARCYDRIGEREKAHSEMIHYVAVASRGWSSDFQLGIPENLGLAINTPAGEWQPLPSVDGLSFLFKRHNTEGYSDYWWTTRETKDSPWKAAMRLTPLEPNTRIAGNTISDDMESYSDGSVEYPRSDILVKKQEAMDDHWTDSLHVRRGTLITGITTVDGLELYSDGKDGKVKYNRCDIFVRKRKAIEDDWGEPSNLGPLVNSQFIEMSPAITPDGLELYFSDFYNATRPGGCGKSDLWVTKRTARDDPWSEPVNLGLTVNSVFGDCRPSLSADGLILLFDSNRSGGMGSTDLYMTRRVTIDAPWEEPVNLGPNVNTPAAEYFPHLSADDTTLYYESDRPGGYGDHDLWQVKILIPNYKSNPTNLTNSVDKPIKK